MAEVFIEFKEKLEKFKSSIQSSRLYLAEYFDKLRNEIDIEAEKCLNKSNQSKIKNDVQKSTDQDTINSNRKQMLDEINSFEIKCFDNLANETLETVDEKLLQEVETFEKTFQELERKQSNLDGDMFENECSNLYQLIDSSIYDFDKKIKLNSSLIFLNVSEFKKCVSLGVVLDKSVDYMLVEFLDNENEEIVENDGEENFDENCINIGQPTTFGFLYILDDCVSKDAFR